jgi:hypothetical protein
MSSIRNTRAPSSLDEELAAVDEDRLAGEVRALHREQVLSRASAPRIYARARALTASATSSGVPTWRTGSFFSYSANALLLNSPPHLSQSSVSTAPGATQFTRSGARSTAAVRSDAESAPPAATESVQPGFGRSAAVPEVSVTDCAPAACACLMRCSEPAPGQQRRGRTGGGAHPRSGCRRLGP